MEIIKVSKDSDEMYWATIDGNEYGVWLNDDCEIVSIHSEDGDDHYGRFEKQLDEIKEAIECSCGDIIAEPHEPTYDDVWNKRLH